MSQVEELRPFTADICDNGQVIRPPRLSRGVSYYLQWLEATLAKPFCSSDNSLSQPSTSALSLPLPWSFKVGCQVPALGHGSTDR